MNVPIRDNSDGEVWKITRSKIVANMIYSFGEAWRTGYPE